MCQRRRERLDVLSQRGLYLLEAGIAMIGVALVVVGIGDVARLYQGRNAVRAAVHEGLRCLYPTDNGCAQSSVSGAASSAPRFDVFTWGTGYQVAQESYSATAVWRTAPVLEVPLERTSLGSVSVQRGRDRYQQQEVLFATEAHLPYLVQTMPLPEVGGADPLRPTFYHPITHREMEPPVVVSLQGVGGVTSRGASASSDAAFSDQYRIGRRSFSLSKVWQNRVADTRRMRAITRAHDVAVPCYQGPLTTAGGIDWRARFSECSYRREDNKLLSGAELSVPVMFHISGNVIASAPDAEGQVLISLSWAGNTRLLGGRVLKPNSSGDFVVRGASWGDIRNEAEGEYRRGGRYEREIELHGALDLIPVDEPVTLNVYLVSLNGKEIGWRGERMVLYHPTFAFRQEQFDCGYSPDPTECAKPPPAAPYLYAEVNESQPLKVQAHGAAQCLATATVPLEANREGRLSRIAQLVARGQAVSPSKWWERNPDGVNGCTTLVESYSCPETVAADLPKGCYVQPSMPSILQHCGVPALVPGRDSVQRVSLRTTVNNVSRRVTACSGDEIPLCAKAHAREVEQTVLGTAMTSESCANARVVRPAVYTVGPVDVNSCSAPASSIERFYRDNYKVPAGVPIAVSRVSSAPRYTSTAPTSACAVFSQTTIGRGAQAECGVNVSWEDAQRCCDRLSGRCRVERVGETPADTSEASAETVVRMEGAVRRAVAAVQSAYPAASYRVECGAGDPDCLQVRGGLVEENSRALMTVRMNVPLLLVRPFGLSGIAVEHSADRVLERMAALQ
jgi:hypothetical protein